MDQKQQRRQSAWVGQADFSKIAQRKQKFIKHISCNLRSKRFRGAKSEETGWCSRPNFRAGKTPKTPFLRSLFHGNLCYAGYISCVFTSLRKLLHRFTDRKTNRFIIVYKSVLSVFTKNLASLCACGFMCGGKTNSKRIGLCRCF